MITKALFLEWLEESTIAPLSIELSRKDYVWAEPILDFETQGSGDHLMKAPKDWVFIMTHEEYQKGILCIGKRVSTRSTSKISYVVVCSVEEKARLARLLQARIREVLEWDRALSQITIGNGSFQDLIDASEAILKNYITLTDASFRLAAFTRNKTIEDFWINELTKNGFHSRESIERFSAMNAIARWSKQRRTRYSGEKHFTKYPIINHVFRLEGEFFLQMVMSCNEVPYSKGLFDLFEILVEHVQAHIENQFAQQSRARSNYEPLFAALLKGETVADGYLDAQLSRLPVNENSSFIVYGLRIDDAQSHEIGYLQGELSMLLPGYFIVKGTEHLYVIVHPSEHNKQAELAHVDALLTSLSERSTFWIGASDEVQGIRSLHHGAEQARIAADNARAKKRTLVMFRDCLCDHVLRHGLEETDFFEHCYEQSEIGAIHRYDEEHGTDYVGFLRVYLENERRIESSAYALDLHRNTITQRLSKLEREFGIETKTPAQRQRLLMLISIGEALGL